MRFKIWEWRVNLKWQLHSRATSPESRREIFKNLKLRETVCWKVMRGNSHNWGYGWISNKYIENKANEKMRQLIFRKIKGRKKKVTIYYRFSCEYHLYIQNNVNLKYSVNQHCNISNYIRKLRRLEVCMRVVGAEGVLK